MSRARSRPTRSNCSNGSEHGHARPKTLAHHGVDRLGIANACGNQRDRLSLHRVLKTVADETRNVPPYMDRRFAGLAQQLHSAAYDAGACLFVLDNFDQRHQIRRVPEMGADDTLAMDEMPADFG